MTNGSVIPDLLQALKHSLEAVDRLGLVVQQFIDAYQGGKPLPPGAVEEYAKQMIRVRADRERMREMVAGWWQTVGQDRAQ